MPTPDPRIDAYIAKAKPFAQPILAHLRALISKTIPEAEETIKWGFPCWVYDGIVCGIAAFKEHAAFVFWKYSIMEDPDGIFKEKDADSHGNLGRITSKKDLPPDAILKKYLKVALQLNKDGVKLPPKKKTPVELDVPAFISKEIKRSNVALKEWDQFSPSKKKEYVEWITEAKTEATREKRMATAVEWISEGKGRNWKYERK